MPSIVVTRSGDLRRQSSIVCGETRDRSDRATTSVHQHRRLSATAGWHRSFSPSPVAKRGITLTDEPVSLGKRKRPRLHIFDFTAGQESDRVGLAPATKTEPDNEKLTAAPPRCLRKGRFSATSWQPSGHTSCPRRHHRYQLPQPSRRRRHYGLPRPRDHRLRAQSPRSRAPNQSTRNRIPTLPQPGRLILHPPTNPTNSRTLSRRPHIYRCTGRPISRPLHPIPRCKKRGADGEAATAVRIPAAFGRGGFRRGRNGLLVAGQRRGRRGIFN